MIAENFLKLLVCPETRSPLHEADATLTGRLNEAIAKKSLLDKSGRVLDTPLDGALVRADKLVAYPIIDKIPMLLVEEGIMLDQLT